MSPAPKQIYKKTDNPDAGDWFFNALICIYFFGLILSIIPQSGFRTICSTIIALPWNALGLWQQWALFAPNAPEYNVQVHGLITYADGQVKLIDVPDDPKQWRLKQVVGVIAPNQNYIWRDLAIYYARKYDAPQNHPKLISFVCELHRIRLPHMEGHREPDDDECGTFFCYQIAAEDLAK